MRLFQFFISSVVCVIIHNGVLAKCEPAPAPLAVLPDFIDEASGIEYSQLTHFIYLHNDSGDNQKIYVTTPDFNVVRPIYLLKSQATDIEDIALGVCSKDQPDSSCVYIADMGDNLHQRPFVKIYRINERDVAKSWQNVEQDIAVVPQVMYIHYPDGRYDSEALFVDEQGRLYVLTKQVGHFRLYTTEFKPSRQSHALTFIADVSISAGWFMENMITAADYESVSRILLLRSYSSTLAFRLAQGADFSQLSRLKPETWPSVFQRQVESIAFYAKGYISTSEGEGQYVYYFDCPLRQK